MFILLFWYNNIVSKVICKNCNGEFSDKLSACPYCGTMHKKGAYANFRKKISDIIDSLLGLKVEVERSTSVIILSAVLRGLLISGFVVGLALINSLFMNTNYYNDKEYDERRLKDIIWQNENISVLDEAYKNNDYETIDKLFRDNSSGVYNWNHYSAYLLKSYYGQLSTGIQDYFDKYVLQDCLYYLYYPDYFVATRKMSSEEYEIYRQDRESIMNMLIEKGYSESELQTIYENNKDEYGYLVASSLEKYVKGEDNG